MGGPSLAEVLPTPDPETVRHILAVLSRENPEAEQQTRAAR